MAAVSEGLKYEKYVNSAVREAASKSKKIVLVPSRTAGFDSNAVDLKIKINNITYNFEVKSDTNAQMGGTSIQYAIYPKPVISPVLGRDNNPTLDYDTYSLIVDALKGTENDVRAFVNFFYGQDPVEFHRKVNGFPMSVSRDAWKDAVEQGLLRPLNRRVRLDTKFIADHYRKKNCYYIQIGGAGLFYLAANPLNLPIPRLTGEIDVEIRAVSSLNSSINATYKTLMVGASLRAQARLKTSATSKYSLDNADDVLTLFDGKGRKTKSNK